MISFNSIYSPTFSQKLESVQQNQLLITSNLNSCLFFRCLALAVLCALLPASKPEAAPEPSPRASANPDPLPEAAAEAYQYYGTSNPHLDHGFVHPGSILGGARSLASTHHVSGGEHSHCALLIPGHGGKSAHFDHVFGGFNDIQWVTFKGWPVWNFEFFYEVNNLETGNVVSLIIILEAIESAHTFAKMSSCCKSFY